ncbi:hypothetical protein ACPVPU_08910 [Sphingomonas sp. CJ99]
MRHAPALLIVLMLAPLAPATAQERPGTDASEERNEKPDDTGRVAGDIASQPARDIGAMPTKTPDVLIAAQKAPYDLTGIKTCRQISAAVTELNTALGPDFDATPEERSREGALAEAGGRAVVNSLIPFRGLVREVSGAAGAERRLQAATDAGHARRGYLRGIHRTRGCKTGF